jgi:hypothetical protein
MPRPDCGISGEGPRDGTRTSRGFRKGVGQLAVWAAYMGLVETIWLVFPPGCLKTIVAICTNYRRTGGSIGGNNHRKVLNVFEIYAFYSLIWVPPSPPQSFDLMEQCTAG